MKPGDPYPRGDRIERILSRHADERPRSVALRQGDTALTYAELVDLAKRIAAGLVAAGVGPGDYVPVRMTRSPEFVATLLGILYTGGAYIALDPRWPDAYVDDIVERARARMVVTRESLGVLAADHRPLPEFSDGRAPACVFFTSGSTGRPKGAVSPHRGTVRTVVGCPTIPLDENSVFLQAAAYPWDAMSFELWGALLNGGRCELLAADQPVLDADALRRAVDSGVNSLWLTSSLFNVFAEECPDVFASARLLVVGGERVSPTHVRTVLTRFPELRVVNGYGPVENTIFTTTHVIRPSDVSLGAVEVPIGEPIPGTAVLLVDEAGDPVPCGEVGELLAGGDGLALGYLGDPGETVRRFVEIDGRAYYRTGDLAVATGEGPLLFRGRSDDQVKIRGVRVEPGQVEVILTRHPAIVSAHVRPVPGASLACLYTTNDGQALDAAELRAFADGALIPAMVPDRFVHLRAMPLNDNGKIDGKQAARLACAAGAGQADGEQAAVDPLLAQVRELLGNPRLTATSDLLDAGVNSLDAIRLAARIGAHLEARIPVGDVFGLRTLSAITDKHTRAGGSPRRPIRAAAGGSAPVPLAHAQQRFWLAEQLEPGLADNMIVLAYRVAGRLDVEALEHALRNVVRHHPILRTIYPEADEFPVQLVLDADEAPIDLTHPPAPPGDLRDVAEAVTADWWDTPFELDRLPPMRIRLCALADDEHLLCLQIHHVAFDGWSESLFMNHIAAAYRARRRSTFPQVSYQDYCRWEHENVDRWRDHDLPFWRTVLTDPPGPFLPEPTPTAEVRRHELTIDVPAETVAGLRSTTARHGGSPAAALLAGTARALAGCFDLDALCLGTVTAGRIDDMSEAIMGYLVNPLPVPFHGLATASLPGVLDKAVRGLGSALDHAATPFDDLVRILRADRQRHPWFQVWSVLQLAPPHVDLDGDVSITPVRIRPPRTSLELMIEAFPQPDGRWTVVQLWREDGIATPTATAIAESVGESLRDIAALST